MTNPHKLASVQFATSAPKGYKEVIVIRIDNHFLGPGYFPIRDSEGHEIGGGNALHALVERATDAYHWNHQYNAMRCAHHIARNECRGKVVEVGKYVVFDSGMILKDGIVGDAS